jgi:hypothetical protein
MKRKPKYTPVEDLYYGMLDVKPVNYDWSEGYAEKWDYLAASRCEKCGELVVGRNGEKHCALDHESECDGYVSENEGPMMNYYYPLPEFRGDVREAAKELAHLPLVIVEFLDSGDYALALSGGGMDLSWEICEAFMLLGYLPPVHFSDLPQMSGRGKSPRDRWIISGCRCSLEGMKEWQERSLERLASNFGYRKPKKGYRSNR